MSVLSTGAEYINVDGNIVEKDALLVAEAINGALLTGAAKMFGIVGNS